MDKFERALEKARSERYTERAPAAPAAHVQQESIQPLPRGNTRVSEEQLESSRIVAHRSRSAEADIFRILRTQVLHAMNKSNLKTLAITSPNYGDGKTTIALNLAISIALDSKQTVLLVDLDLRKPSVDRYLDILPQFGLTDHLLNNVPLSDCLVRLQLERLVILPSGKKMERSSETLGSAKMAALADELKMRYPNRLIIYDMPPILAQDDPIAFLPHVDAALLVVRDGVTKTQEVKRCVNALSHTYVIGTILNNAV